MAIGYLARVTLHQTSGLPEDDIVQDYAYTFPSGTPANADFSALRGHIVDFLATDATGPTSAPSKWMSGIVDRTTSAQFDVYAVPDTVGNLGSPVYSSSFGPLSALVGTASNLPSECAVVLSYNADLTGVLEESGTTRPRARRRGRLYVGPLNQRVIDASDPTAIPRPTANFLTALRVGAKDYLFDAAALDGWEWAVWSRADWTMRDVVAVSTDDAFDTIRSRGEDATARTSLVL